MHTRVNEFVLKCNQANPLTLVLAALELQGRAEHLQEISGPKSLKSLLCGPSLRKTADLPDSCLPVKNDTRKEQ